MIELRKIKDTGAFGNSVTFVNDNPRRCAVILEV